jgi:hypothetical protein
MIFSRDLDSTTVYTHPRVHFEKRFRDLSYSWAFTRIFRGQITSPIGDHPVITVEMLWGGCKYPSGATPLPTGVSDK